MDLIKKHVDTVIVLTWILGMCVWINGKFNAIEKDIIQIKTVLIMQKIMPTELAVKEK